MFNLLSIGTAWEAKQVSVPHKVGEELETRCEYYSDPCQTTHGWKMVCLKIPFGLVVNGEI
jgi:hypothetical protein